MKKIISVILTVVLSAAFIACSKANYSEITFYATKVSDGAAITNASDTDCNVTVIVAEYDDNGILTKVISQKMHFEKNEEKNITFTVSNIYKIFIWDNVNGIIQCELTNKEDTMIDIPQNDDIMLIDYFHKTIATVGGDGYYEIVLCYYSDTKVKLSVYERYEGYDKEYCKNYIVPYEVADKCYEIIKKNKLREWNKRYDDLGIDGSVTVCKFRDDDGTYTRVSTDAMPDNGKDILGQIRQTMESYIKEEYRQ